MKKLLIIGSTCVDVIIKLDHLPKTGEDLHPEWQHFAMGGCAYNAAQIPRALGLNPCLVTPVGTKGVFSGFVWQKLSQQGFRGPVRVDNAENGCCYCFVEKSGERTFVSVHGIEYSFDPSYMKSLESEVFDYTYICGLEVEEPTGASLVSWLERHKEATGTVIYAPGPRGVKVDADLTRRIFQLHPILHLNETEVLELGSHLNISTAALKLYRDTQNLVVVTMGERGVYWRSADGRSHDLPAVKTSVRDTIGAGDSHCGAFLSGLSLGMTEQQALSFASEISAAVVSIEGSTLPDDTIQEIARKYLADLPSDHASLSV